MGMVRTFDGTVVLLIRCLAVVVLGLVAAGRGESVRRIVRSDESAANLLEEKGWRPYQKAFGFGREGEAFVCDNGRNSKAQGGVTQTVTFDKPSMEPIIASAWSKAEGVDGGQNADYSLYLDIVYDDGEPLWGQVASFKTGTHDWQRAEVKVFPAKPVKQVAFYMLLRSHGAKAWFKQPRLYRLGVPGGAAMFDGQYVKKDAGAVGSFWVRDVAADSDYVCADQGAALGLKLSVDKTRRGDVTFYSGSLVDTTGKDRAVTLIHTLALPGEGWRFMPGVREDASALPAECVSAGGVGAVGTGRLSKYPLAVAGKAEGGWAVALDMGKPAFFRVGFAGTGELYVAYDFGLAAEKSAAEFAFCEYPVEGGAGLRGGVARLYQIYPEYFRCRTPEQGLWMPFAAISKVEGWEDFGFKFKEGVEEAGWDGGHGISTFRYTEPMTWWMAMPKAAARTTEGALAEAKRLAGVGNREAQALVNSGFEDEEGRRVPRLAREPWCDGAVWSMNSSPGIAGEVTDFKNKWNAGVKEKLYGKGRKAELGGEYIDSIEGYVTADLDFCRGHFAGGKTPLVFSASDHRPAVFKGLVVYEYTRVIGDDIHAMGKLMMANGTPGQWCWLAPWLDVMGTEMDWNPGGKWRPMSDDELIYRRMLCGPKPYCFLMNTDFAKFSHEMVEKYMKRALAYGMFPGFFSANASEGHYFTQPKLYNRDRDLFKKYVPLCKRVAEAGWRPVTRATSGDAKVYVERFGGGYLTVFNDSGQKKDVVITVADGLVQGARDLVRGNALATTGGRIRLELEAEDVALIALPAPTR